MSLRTLPLLILFFSATSMAQSKHFLLMGGGGEEPGPTTLFDKELQYVGKFMSKSNWRTDTSFNGGHSKTERILAENFEKKGVKNVPFTNSSFEEKIKAYEEKILSGQIAPGDQLLIQISSHGAIQRGSQKTHQIATNGDTPENLIDLKGASLVSLDALEKLSKLAQEKGIKLGILDFSCHSGSTLALANSNTCVISSTGPKHFSWASSDNVFQAKFTKKIKKGKSLEDVFLSALEDKNDTSFPMISTPLGREIQDQTYPNLTPFFYDARGEVSLGKFQKHLENEFMANSCRALPKQFEELTKFSHEMEKVAKSEFLFFKTDADFGGFRKALTRYYDKQNSILDSLSRMESDHYNKPERFCSDFHAPGRQEKDSVCLFWSVKEMLSVDFDKYISLLEEQIKTETSAFKMERKKAQIRNIGMAKARAKSLSSQSESFVKSVDFFKRFPNLKEETEEMARDVAEEFQEMYVSIYKEKRKSEKKSNPCRDIKF